MAPDLPHAPRPAKTPGRGGTWPARDHPTVIWLTLAGLAALAHPWWPGSGWVVVHLLLLGALTHSVLVWSTHFAQALLKTRPDLDPRAHQSGRLWGATLGSALVVVGVPSGLWWLTLAGASLLVAAVSWHALALGRRVRIALPGRFRITLRYYLAAAACLPVGATFGVLLARGFSAEAHARLLVAHTLTMLLGWFGLTVAGTLITLWPTMLRTRIDDRAELLAKQAFPVLVGAVVVVDAGALVGIRAVAAAGVTLYLAGLVWWGRALVAPASRRSPREFATVSVACGLAWAVVVLALLIVALVTRPSWSAVYAGYGPIAALAALGFGLQIMIGALSYLIPVVLGGGPSMARAVQAPLNRGAATRILLTNAAIATFVLPMASGVRTPVQVVGLLAAGSFLPLLASAIFVFIKARRSGAAPEVPDSGNFWTPTGVALAVGALVASVAIGTVAASNRATTAVTPTGHTTTVTVTAKGMRFTPSSISVPRGDRLVITLVNADSTTSHDLVLASGVSTPLLAPGATARLDAGIIGASEQGWCSVPGHRQMGMTFAVDVTGAASTASASGMSTGMTMPMASSGVAALNETPFDPGFTAVNPVLPPLTSQTVHKLTWHMREVPVQVAPGVWQTRWTYEGGVPGPVLHGRVGDRFEITLVNDMTMGHSIDFHAGNVSPDNVMRTIPPGGSLVYRFTAERAGAWLYHCSTMPMSAHIAAGMFGAVVVEPKNLPTVDHSYLFVQSEVYLGGSTAKPTATLSPGTVDAARVAADHPDAVVFNGSAFQYLQHPIAVRAGQRLRVWVIDAGPNRPLDFHVVGTQFDTVWAEGAYLLPRGTDGGSQVLSLGAAQGGFVEFTLREPGHYHFVNHAMSDAERGANGVFAVSVR